MVCFFIKEDNSNWRNSVYTIDHRDNSSDALYNYPLIILGHIEIFEGDMKGMHYYCYVPLQKQTPNNVSINYECGVISRGWLVVAHDENGIKLEK